jgi:hypothetical protein
MAAARLTLLLLAVALVVAALTGCGSDANIRDTAKCDGVLNTTETTVDDAFDEDGDGYFDAENEQCQETYGVEDLDCDDEDELVNPGMQEETCNDLDDDCDELTVDAPDTDEDGATPCEGDCDDSNADVGPEMVEVPCDGLDNDCDAATIDAEDLDGDGYENCDDCDDENAAISPAEVEIECNGADDDCNEVTPDGEDFDNDGVFHCFDCDDADPLRFPGNPEICEDGIDQNCDTIDDECPPPDWGGIWDTNAVSYSCASNSVVIDFASISILDENPSISFTFIGGTQPGTVAGTLSAGDAFSAAYSISGLCTEGYDFSGTFTGPNTFTGYLTASFTDTTGTGYMCYDCTNQTFLVNGTR